MAGLSCFLEGPVGWCLLCQTVRNWGIEFRVGSALRPTKPAEWTRHNCLTFSIWEGFGYMHIEAVCQRVCCVLPSWSLWEWSEVKMLQGNKSFLFTSRPGRYCKLMCKQNSILNRLAQTRSHNYVQEEEAKKKTNCQPLQSSHSLLAVMIHIICKGNMVGETSFSLGHLSMSSYRRWEKAKSLTQNRK